MAHQHDGGAGRVDDGVHLGIGAAQVVAGRGQLGGAFGDLALELLPVFGQGLFGLFLRRDVVQYRMHQLLAAAPDRRQQHLHRKSLAIGTLMQPFELVKAAFLRDPAHLDRLLGRVRSVGLQGRRNQRVRLADQLLRALHAQHVERGAVGRDDVACLEQQDGLAGVLEQGAEAVLALGQFGGPALDHLPGGPDPAAQQQHDAEQDAAAQLEVEQQGGLVRIERGTEPFAAQLGIFLGADGLHAAHDQRQRLRIALAHRAMELSDIELERLAEVVADAELVEVEVGRRLVEAEDLDFGAAGGAEQGLVVVVLQQRRDAPFGELVDAGVALLHADLEALERLHIADAADRGMAVDVDRQPGVGRREVVERLAWRRAIDHVDHIGFALLELALRLGPLRRAELDRNPGLLLPQLPVVDQVALDLAVGVAEQIGRVVVVADDVQGVRVGQGIGGRQQQAGPAQAERKQASATDIR